MFMLQRAAVLPGEFALLHKLTKLFGRLFLNSAQLLQDWAVERKLFDRPRALSEADNLLSAYQQPRRATGNALHLRSRGAVFYHLQEVIVRRLKYTETNLAAGNPVLHGLRCELGRVLGYQSDEIGVCLPLCQRAPVNMRPPRNLLIRKPVFSHQHSRGLVLRKAKLWSNIEDDVVMLKERTDIGRELSDDEIHRLLTICKGSVSRGIYPADLTSIHTGLRSQELRLLRWHQVDLIEGIITVGKSKTAAGEGRLVYLSGLAVQTLQNWRSQFLDVQPSHAVFPSERYGLKGKKGSFGGQVVPSETFPARPIRSFAKAWKTAKKAAGVECRWHDLRTHARAGLLLAAPPMQPFRPCWAGCPQK
jgi:Phage integrase family